jgi:hypothetical protein
MVQRVSARSNHVTDFGFELVLSRVIATLSVTWLHGKACLLILMLPKSSTKPTALVDLQPLTLHAQHNEEFAALCVFHSNF